MEAEEAEGRRREVEAEAESPEAAGNLQEQQVVQEAEADPTP